MKNNTTKDGYMPAPLIKGCWQFSADHGAASIHSGAIDDLITFADAGIRTFDCADIYTGVEEFLGAFRKEYARRRGEAALADIRIHTKFVPDRDKLGHIDRAYVERIIDRSLMRLGVESLDLVQFHWWDFDTSGYVETANILRDLQTIGKIKHIGVTNFDTDHLQEVIGSGVRVVTNQVQYSVLDRRPEHGLATYCLNHDIKLLCYGTVAGGFLGDAYVNHSEPIPPFSNRSLVKYKLIVDDVGGWAVYQNMLKTLRTIGFKHGVSVSTVAMRYVMEKPAVAGIIVGANARHIEDVTAAKGWSFDEEDTGLIEAASNSLLDLPGDVYLLERDKNSRHASIMKYNLNA